MGWAVAVVGMKAWAEETEVARGGWAEDARCPPATRFVSVVIPASQGYRRRASAASEPSGPRAG